MILFLRYLGLTILATLLSSNIDAQSVATDFTLTDIDGTEHNLYSYLEDGKTVILNFAITSSPSSWTFHQTGAMNTAYNSYGPNGSDEMVFLFLEIDDSSTLTDLQGTGSNTQGDWLTGYAPPVIDDAADTANAYGVAGVPHIIAVCSDRSITDLFTAVYPTATTMYDAHNNCPMATTALDVALISHDISQTAVCDTLAFTPKMTIQNNGTDAITTAVFRLEYGTTLIQDLPWSGSLATFSLTDVEFDPVALTTADTLRMSVIQINGSTDTNTTNNQLAQGITTALTSTTNSVTIKVVTDNFGCETYWEFRNSDIDSLIAFGGNPTVMAGGQTVSYPCDPAVGYANNTTYTDTITITADGCYEFYLIDDYGDGMCCQYGNGSYSIEDEAGDILFSGGAYDDMVIEALNLTTYTATENLIAEETFQVFPNPAQDYFNVEFDVVKSTKMEIALFNALGQQVKTIPSTTYVAGHNTLAVNTSKLPNGIYILTLQTEEGNISRKVTINKQTLF